MLKRAAGFAQKVEKLFNIIRNDPFAEFPRYEILSGDLKGYYSRRINIQHRLIYAVDKKARTVAIFRLWTHYEGLN
ncbi:Txe/YoeB family addiction module toxin [Candidatus Saccharibacteria bacterium]|nr:Txe/YoeB family addiction module toxin [Candidatus Saccharibacteria bacterium]